MTTKVTGSVLANTAVTAGTYGGSTNIPVVTVDAQGRTTYAANVSLTTTSVYGNTGQITANTATGVVAVGLATSGAIAGSYGSGTTTPVISVDAYGRITSVSATTITGGSAGIGATTFNRQSNTATSGQTVFTVNGGYTVGYLQVYLNGVLLNASDYTASNGTSFTLATGATTGDIVESIAYTVSTVLNVGPSPSGGLAGQVLYQTAANTTGNTDVGTASSILTSAGSGKPYWAAQSSLVIANTQITGVMTASQLAATAVTPGTYGGSATAAVITVDQQGRLTAAANAAISGGGFSNIQVFVQNGTFTVPAGVTKIKVTVMGGGGGGSGHTNQGSAGGAGGTSSFLLSTTGITCTGGSGGLGSPGAADVDGADGGSATVSGEITGSAIRSGGQKGSYNVWRSGIGMGGSTPLGTGGIVFSGGGPGAGGGSRTDEGCNSNGSAGGSGGYASALFAVTPTNVWTVVVGGGGGGGGSSTGGAGTNGATVTAGTAGGGGGIGAAGGGGGFGGAAGGTPTTKAARGYSAGGSGTLSGGGGGGGGGIVIVEY